MSNPLMHLTKQPDESVASFLVLTAVKLLLAFLTFFAYPLLYPLMWKASVWISTESQVRRSQHRQAISAEARRRNARTGR